jgi:hypothetical protein
MKSCIVNPFLICCLSLLVTGCTTTKKTPTDSAETVRSDGNITSADGETPAAQSEPPQAAPGGRLASPSPSPQGKSSSTSPNLMAPATALTPPTVPPRPALYVGPTQNITAVANALTWNHKSLTILITITRGLALTHPVTISIAYLSPVPGGPERQTQGYAALTGNQFLRGDPEGNGQPRRVHVDITLSEPNPAGGVYNYNVPMDLDLVPLYDVTLGTLQFSLLNDCATVAFGGDTHIKLRWMNPLAQQNDAEFATRGGKMTVITGFAWNAQEVNASQFLRMPEFGFLAYSTLAADLWHEPYFNPAAPWDTQTHTLLALGPTHTITIRGGVKAFNDSYCSAYYEYRITATLRAYFGAATVRDHREEVR